MEGEPTVTWNSKEVSREEFYKFIVDNDLDHISHLQDKYGIDRKVVTTKYQNFGSSEVAQSELTPVNGKIKFLITRSQEEVDLEILEKIRLDLSLGKVTKQPKGYEVTVEGGFITLFSHSGKFTYITSVDKVQEDSDRHEAIKPKSGETWLFKINDILYNTTLTIQSQDYDSVSFTYGNWLFPSRFNGKIGTGSNKVEFIRKVK